uniref:WD_REPEATS_REGION domain-containing protein n=1 Tax=Anisakis simplex TaxID=6269 RepID=A0A0M3J2M4_ANISI
LVASKMPSLFVRDGGRKGDYAASKELKRKQNAAQKMSAGKGQKRSKRNEEISSDEDISADEGRPPVRPGLGPYSGIEEIDDDDQFEDVQQTAYRKAKQLLADIRAEEKTEEGEENDEAVAHRLHEEALSHVVTLHRKIAQTAKLSDSVVQFSTVAVAISHDARYICSCSKDATIVKYDIEEGKKVGQLKYDKKTGGRNCHKGHILALAISAQDRFLVSGGQDAVIRVWNFVSLDLVKELTGHKNAITGLTFRLGTQQLFSCSRDRSVKAWDLDQMGYVDTMFGHVDAVMGIDILGRRCEASLTDSLSCVSEKILLAISTKQAGYGNFYIQDGRKYAIERRNVVFIGNVF